jgi:hypothetical protein
VLWIMYKIGNATTTKNQFNIWFVQAMRYIANIRPCDLSREQPPSDVFHECMIKPSITGLMSFSYRQACDCYRTKELTACLLNYWWERKKTWSPCN